MPAAHEALRTGRSRLTALDLAGNRLPARAVAPLAAALAGRVSPLADLDLEGNQLDAADADAVAAALRTNTALTALRLARNGVRKGGT